MSAKKTGFHQQAFGDWSDKEEPARTSAGIVPLDFESHAIRMILIKGEPWWVAVDVCRAIGIENARQALTRLDEDEKGVISNDGANLNLINEPGLYSLILGARRNEDKPQIQRFKRWITHEVLPSLRKYGHYSMPGSENPQIERDRRRHGFPKSWNDTRQRSINANKSKGGCIARAGGTRTDHAASFNGLYRGLCNGREAADLKKITGYKNTPLKHMGVIPLAAHALSTEVLTRRMEDSEKPLDNLEDLAEGIARTIGQNTLRSLGSEYAFGHKPDRKGGRVIDVVQKQLA